MSGHAGVCKVFIAAEGPSELGELAKVSQWREKRPREGYFQPMLRQLLGDGLTFDGQKIMVLRRYENEETGKLHIHADRAAMALAIARSEGCQVVVFAHDVDREQGTKPGALERRRRIAEMHAQIEAGFASVHDAEHICRLKATPLRMIEAWALGDAEAVAAVAGKHGLRATIPSEPEEAWGDKRNPASDYPKCILKRVLDREPTAEDFAEVAARSKVERLRSTCPLSFAPFADEADAAAKKLGLQPAPQPVSTKPRPRRRR
jgi:hypothetical protein